MNEIYEDIINTQENIESDNTDIVNNETILEEHEVFEVPDYVPDEYLPPEKFESIEEETNFYRDSYGKLIKFMESDNLKEHLKSQIKIEPNINEEDIEEIEAVRTMLKEGEPTAVIKMFAPDYISKMGSSPILSENEKKDFVVNQLMNKFGKNYDTKYDENEAMEQGTLSYNMLQYQQELSSAIDEYNEANKVIAEQNQPLTQEEIQLKLNEQYEKDFKDNDWKEEEFHEFVNIAIDYASSDKITLADVHKIMYFDNYMDDMYKKGLEDGKRGITKDLSRLPNSEVKHQIVDKPTNDELPIYNPFGNFGRQSIIDNVKKIRR